MTERQKALLENLPKCNNVISKAALMSGYSENTSKSSIYNLIRNSKNTPIASEEVIRKRYLKKVKKLQKLMKKDKDNTNLMRSIEIEGKVEGLFKETLVNEGIAKEIIINYGHTKQPEGVSISKSE